MMHKAKGVKICQVLGLRNIPHIGIYGFNYEWIPTISYFKSIGGENWEAIVPKKARLAVGKLLSEHKFKVGTVDYMCVNYNSNMFKQRFFQNLGQKWVRFNMVYHPYLMDYLKEGIMQESKWVMASLYTDDHLAFGLSKSKFNGIKINSEDLFTEDNWIEVHIHRADENDPKAMAVSPNNAAVLIDMSCPIIPFYSVVIDRIEKEQKINIMITHHCIIDET